MYSETIEGLNQKDIEELYNDIIEQSDFLSGAYIYIHEYCRNRGYDVYTTGYFPYLNCSHSYFRINQNHHQCIYDAVLSPACRETSYSCYDWHTVSCYN